MRRKSTSRFTKFRFILLLLLMLPFRGHAQDSLSLQDCIELALRQNTAVRRSANALQQSQYALTQHRAGFLPTLDGMATQRFNFGRAIDPTTNVFTTQRINSNFFSLSSDLLLFNGLQRQMDLRRLAWEREANRFALQSQNQEISLNIANMYLQVMLLVEQRRQLEAQLDNSTLNLQRAQRMVEAGAQPHIRLLEAEAQVANDESMLVQNETQIEQALLDLRNAMNYGYERPLHIKHINVPALEPAYGQPDLEVALKEKYRQLPGIMQAEAQIESAEFATKAAKGNYYSPRLFFNSGVTTGYSSGARELSGIQFGGLDTIGYTVRDQNPVVAPNIIPTFGTIPFNQQLTNNFGQFFSFNLAVPIFGGLQNRYNYQLAKIQELNTGLQFEDVLNNTRREIYTSFLSMRQAQKRLEVNRKQLDVQQRLADQAERNYQAGASSYFDYSLSRINLITAQANEVQARYELYFQTKVFEFYLGKPLEF